MFGVFARIPSPLKRTTYQATQIVIFETRHWDNARQSITGRGQVLLCVLLMLLLAVLSVVAGGFAVDAQTIVSETFTDSNLQIVFAFVLYLYYIRGTIKHT